MVEKFEVGKSYAPRGISEFSPIEIKYVGEYRSFYRFPSGQEGTILNSDTYSYNEYVEPKIEKFVKTIVRCGDNPPYLTHCVDITGLVLGRIEIILTDGKLSSVNIVE
jgi:hypothetical protein